MTRGRVSLLRQWNKLNLVARHLAEVASLPLLFRLVDPFLARGDEIPPDVARAVHRRAAEHNEMRVGGRRDRRGIAGLEYEEPPGFEFITGDIDRAIDHVDRTFLMTDVERQHG